MSSPLSQLWVLGCGSQNFNNFVAAIHAGLSPLNNDNNVSVPAFDNNSTSQITTKYYSAETNILRVLTTLDGSLNSKLVGCSDRSSVQACVLFAELNGDAVVPWAENVVTNLQTSLYRDTTVIDALSEASVTADVLPSAAVGAVLSGEAQEFSKTGGTHPQGVSDGKGADVQQQLNAVTLGGAGGTTEIPRCDPSVVCSDTSLRNCNDVDDDKSWSVDSDNSVPLSCIPIKLLIVYESAELNKGDSDRATTSNCSTAIQPTTLKRTYLQSLIGWCFDMEFELVQLAGDLNERSTNDNMKVIGGNRGLLHADDSDDESGNGIGRVIEALHTHIWPGMQLVKDHIENEIAADGSGNEVQCNSNANSAVTVVVENSRTAEAVVEGDTTVEGRSKRVDDQHSNSPAATTSNSHAGVCAAATTTAKSVTAEGQAKEMKREMENLEKIERLVVEMQQVREKNSSLSGCDEERRHLASDAIMRLLDVIGCDEDV
eukprot:Lankesteria_metandrocarpae@DN4321_c0_g1_i1.p1